MDKATYRYPEMRIIGKGKKPRVIFISQDAHKAVHHYLSLRKDFCAPLFISHGRDKGKRLSTVMIEKIVSNYAKQAKLSKKVTPHTVRHTFSTELLRQGVDIRYIQEYLGHSSILTTMIYTHVSNPALKSIHEKYLK